MTGLNLRAGSHTYRAAAAETAPSQRPAVTAAQAMVSTAYNCTLLSLYRGHPHGCFGAAAHANMSSRPAIAGLLRQHKSACTPDHHCWQSKEQ